MLSSNKSILSPQAATYDTDKLLISTIDISKPSMCSVADISSNFLRVITQLWKITVTGTVDSDLKWANPNSIIPLRINAFATMLQLLGSSTMFLSKRGLTQLDGKDKWSLRAISKVLALIFDERELFGEQANEPFSKEFFAKKDVGAGKKAQKRRSHVRSNFEFHKDGNLHGSLENVSSVLGGSDFVFSGSASGSDLTLEMEAEMEFQAKAKEIAAKWKDGTKSSSESREAIGDEASSVPSETTKVRSLSEETPWIDSVNDFKSALETGYREAEGDSGKSEDDSEGKSRGELAAMEMINAFSGPLVGRRRFMTAPTPSLGTINEDAAGVVSPFVKARKNFQPLDSLDTELFLKPSKSKVKQFRRPKVIKERSKTIDLPPSAEEDGGDRSLEDIVSGITAADIHAFSPEEKKRTPVEIENESVKKIPTSDEEIESAGISFLEAIEKSFGLG